MQTRPPLSAWLTLACVSLLFFLVTALTFSSLGVVLPAMIAELGWGWSVAGLGFSLLGVFCGVTSTLAAWLIRRIGVRATLAAGGVTMAAAFACLALTKGAALYCLGCSLAGLGFTLLATVPGTYLLARCFARPALPVGLYFTLGGLGGVAGPLLYFWIGSAGGGWRDFWTAAAVMTLAAALAGAVLVDAASDLSRDDSDPRITRESWSVGAALRTPQFAVLAAAYSVFLIVGITVNAVSVAHLMRLGVATMVAGSLMSLEAFLNAGARLLGGLVARHVAPRTLLVFALAALIVGLLALSQARDTGWMLVYAAGIGIGYGLTFFAATILLLDYYGRGPNLELFAIVNLISTIGAVGPAFAGLVADRMGSFVPAFLMLALLVGGVLIAVLAMKPPLRRAQ